MIVICDQSSPKSLAQGTSTVLQGIVIRNQRQFSICDYFKKKLICGQTLKESMHRAYYRCCFAVMFLLLKNKLKLVMKSIELELWIASLTKWNFIAEHSSR